LPKFIDLSSDASQSAVDGVAGAISSASSVNYGARKANSSKGVAVANCSDAGSLLQGGLPTGYTVTAAAIAADTTVSCVVNGQNGKTANASVVGIP
jgi:MSHA pilin protein MshA